MTDVRLILCTFPDLAQARQIGTALVETQLAACVNFIPGIESVYRWEGKIESAGEVLAIFKTTAAAWPAFETALTEMHPYDVPEIVEIEPTAVTASYVAWIHAAASAPS